MSTIKGVQKAQVFISSLNRYPFGQGTLSDFRTKLRDKIESQFPFLAVIINEDWSASAGAPRKTTEQVAQTCHIFIGILVENPGYKDKSGLSATQIEFVVAQKDAEKMLIFLHEGLRDSKVLTELGKKHPQYLTLVKSVQDYVGGNIVRWFKGPDDLEAAILDALTLYTAQTLRTIRRFPAYASEKPKEEAEWELMTFAERYQAMQAAFRAVPSHIKLESTVIQELKPAPRSGDPDVYKLRLRLDDQEVELPVLFSACPDRFGFPDAARYVGYPFRARVEGWQEELGPLDMTLVFRTATDSQIRRHLGNPDIHVSQESWGFFAADPERYIQVAYLNRCSSSQKLETQVARFLAWLEQYSQIRPLVERAQVRGRILGARK
jgi:hypothetical protein